MNDQTSPHRGVARVSAHLECLLEGSTTTIASLALAQGHAAILRERLEITLDGEPLEPAEVLSENGTRLHDITTSRGGLLLIDYEADAEHRGLFAEGQRDATPDELIRYTRQSRYIPSDVLLPSCYAHFPLGDFPAEEPAMLAGAIATWVYSELAYVIGSSRFTDDARDTYMARRGVCRDFAHLTVAFLRSRSIPARVASVYAPGLRPMDFHLVAEAYYNGRWNVFDSTRLSSTDTLLRIATGRDAADTAFLSTLKGSLSLKKLTVNAELLEEAAA